MRPIMIREVKAWHVFLFGLAYAAFLGAGLPLWDDDYGIWLPRAQAQGFGSLLWQLVSPAPSDPSAWGFMDRTLQVLVYRVCYAISGYDGWAYFAYKSLTYGGLGAMIYLWSRRLVGTDGTRTGEWASFAAALFFLLAPGPMAAFVWHADFATTAELLFLGLTYLLWREVERIPTAWPNAFLPPAGHRKAWAVRWAGCVGFAYLAYRSKGDLKLVPVILTLYLFALRERRAQWKLFALPLGLMFALAVPWSAGVFRQAPPFLPGSQGASVGWMWQPASWERLRDFLWSSTEYASILHQLQAPTLSFSAVLGPFVLVPLLGLLVFEALRRSRPDPKTRSRPWSPEARARLFAAIWLAVALAGCSALAGIPYFFRIRYGILLLVPGSLLLAWGFAEIVRRLRAWPSAPVWLGIAVTLYSLQTGFNLSRSLAYRADLGRVMSAVEQVYAEVETRFPDAKLGLVGFPGYAQPPEVASAIRDRRGFGSWDEARSQLPLGALVISWNPSLDDSFPVVSAHSGCKPSVWFDRIRPCAAGKGAYLHRFIGVDPRFAQARALQGSDPRGALAIWESILKDHPGSLAAHLAMAVPAIALGEWNKADHSLALVEGYLPNDARVLYNHALVLKSLGQEAQAMSRFERVLESVPGDYGSLYHLHDLLQRSGKKARAEQVASEFFRRYPSGSLK